MVHLTLTIIIMCKVRVQSKYMCHLVCQSYEVHLTTKINAMVTEAMNNVVLPACCITLLASNSVTIQR